MPKQPADERADDERAELDRQHTSDERGEHRYPDAGQTPAERSSRQGRDDLKRRLAGTPRDGAVTHDSRYGADTRQSGAQMPPSARQTVVNDLRDLISALDRRVPHLERQGEHAIARDAAALRADAVKRIAELDTESHADDFDKPRGE